METALIAILAFVPMLIMLVVIHEWGHFFTARAFGVKVLEFGIGYPPRAFGIYSGSTRVLLHHRTKFIGCETWADLTPGQLVRIYSLADQEDLVAARIEVLDAGAGHNPLSLQDMEELEVLVHQGRVRQADGQGLTVADMLYSVNWLPLGGFVRLAGENSPSVPRSLAAQGVGPRAVILASGALMNAIFPFIAFTLMFMLPHNVTVGQVAVEQVVNNSPAQAAGLRPGDIITHADGREIEQGSDLIRATALNAGSEMEWTVQRNGLTEIVHITPRANPPPGEGATGIAIDLVNPRSETRFELPWTAAIMGVSRTWDMLTLLWQEISGWIGGSRSPQLSGPVGIAQATGEITQQNGLQGWLVLSILFSINLAILNLLPIPMLDGGRLVFVALEWVRGGKRIPPQREGLVHLIGFIVLIGFILVITYQDILRLIQGGSLLGG